MTKNNQIKTKGRAAFGTPGYKNVNFLLPEQIHRRIKAAADLKGLTLRAYLNKIIEQAA